MHLIILTKPLVALSATSEEVFIISFVSVSGAPAGIASASFTLVFSLTTGIIKKVLQITINKRRNHNKILVLAKSKLNIETLISQALIDLEIGNEEFIRIAKEKEKYEKMQEYLRKVNEKIEEKTENMRLNSVNSSTSKNIFLLLYI